MADIRRRDFLCMAGAAAVTGAVAAGSGTESLAADLPGANENINTKTRSVKLAYKVIGAGPPVVLVHGIYGSAREWWAIAKGLAARHQVFMVDQRNHMDSPWTNTASPQEGAEDIVTFIEDRGLKSAALIGHSMGGLVSMVAALSRPDRVSRVVSVDAAPFAYEATELSLVMLRAMRDAKTQGVQLRGDVEQDILARIPTPEVRAFALKSIKFMTENLVPGGDGFEWRLNFATLEKTMHVITKFPDLGGRKFDQPSLFIGGANSPFRPRTHEDAVRRYFPGATVVDIPDAMHWVHLDQSDKVLARLLPFLAG